MTVTAILFASILFLFTPAGSAQSTSCVDQVGWTDAYGYTCSDYQLFGWCKNGWYGPNWKSAWGVFSSYCVTTSKACVGADAACCACGRNPALDAVDCVVGNWSGWSNCSLVGDPENATCQQTRIRAVLTMPRAGGAGCGQLVQIQSCPIDSCHPCSVSPWGDWQCFAPNYQLRTRNVTTPSLIARCPALAQGQKSTTCASTPPLPADGYLMQPLGNNNYGQLGLDGVGFQNNLSILVTLPFGVPITGVACGNLHTAVLASGLLFVAGDNENGQLGLGDLVERTTFQMLPSPDSTAVLLVSLGAMHSGFLTARGTVYMFGANVMGQLGLGNYTSSLIPAELRARGGRYFRQTGLNVSSLSLGGQTSALVTGDGAAYTFGLNLYGQMGVNSTISNFSYPTHVRGLIDDVIVSVAVGKYNTIFLSATGTAYAAGSNNRYQLGLSSAYYTVRAPVAIPNITVSSVSMLNKHALFILVDNTVLVAGDNTYGQLGLPPAYSVLLQPVNLSLSTSVLGVATGISYAAVYDMDGDVYIAGSDGNQAGLASCEWSSGACTTFSMVPNPQYAGNIVAMAGGGFHLALLKTKTNTPTPTGTMTLTGTSSMTITETQPPTPTPSFPLCGPQSLSLVGSSWTLTSPIRCTQVLALGSGSDDWHDRFVALRIQALNGDLELRVAPGCTGNCTASYTAADVGSEKLLQLSPTPAAALSLLVSGEARRGNSRAGQPTLVDITFYLVYNGSILYLSLLCAAAAAIASNLVTVTWLALHCWDRHRITGMWKRNPRTRSLWQKWLLACTTWGIMTGAAWCVIVVLTSNPDPRPMALLGLGAALLGVSALTLTVYSLWALRDPVQYRCVSCDQPVSRWRFRGTYLPDPDNPMLCRKAHTAHIQCVACNTPVIRSGWLGATKLRPYHLSCWELHCSKLLNDPTAITRWVADHPPDGPPETELAHLLDAAVRGCSMSSINELLRLNPSLVGAPISDEGGRSALHVAARGGNLPVLEVLLQANPYCLDPAFHMPSERRPSISLQHIGEDSDLYIHIPFLTLNRRPVYCGHSRGRYLYWYDPSTDTGEEKYTPGWCVATQLGSGISPWRMPLLGTGTVEEEERPATRRRPKRSYVTDTLAIFFSSTKVPQTRRAPRDPTSPANKAVTATRQSRSLWRRKKKEEGPEEEEAAGPATPTAAVHAEVKVDFLFHAVSLLEEAVASADERTIRYVAQLYRERHPQCLTWQHHTGHRLWDDYPASSQAAICAALQTGQATVAVAPTPDTTATLDLARRVQTAHLEVAPARCRMGPLFQRRGDDLSRRYEVTSDPSPAAEGYGTVITLSPIHTFAAAPYAGTVPILWEEGLVDLTLLNPPFKVGGAVPKLSAAMAMRQSDDLLKAEVSSAMGLNHALPEPPTTVDPAAEVLSQTEGEDDPPVTQQESDDAEAEDSRPAVASTGIGNRLQDGLEGRQTCDTLPLYGPGYCNKKGCLPFCAELPANPLGMRFELPPIVQMAADALMKLAELQRQRFPLAARHIIAAYVYSYELQGDVDQIYGEMNKAMRLRDMPKVEYWRPLIWDIDMALRALPSYEGKSYRGIKCQVSPAEFVVGGTICWTAFSSASQRKAVAEEFAKPPAEGRGVGTLFFVTSFGAKPISAISRFPDEAEVLFPPNTLFQVTSTLFGNSEIGEFYKVVDNVAMTQVSGGQLHPTSAAPPALRLQRLPQHKPFVLHVPAALANLLLDPAGLTTGVQLKLLSSAAAADDDEDGPVAELQLLQCLPSLPDPIVAGGSTQRTNSSTRGSELRRYHSDPPAQPSRSESPPIVGRTFQGQSYSWKPSALPQTVSLPSNRSSSSDNSLGNDFPVSFPNSRSNRRPWLLSAHQPNSPTSLEKVRLLHSQPYPSAGLPFHTNLGFHFPAALTPNPSGSFPPLWPLPIRVLLTAAWSSPARPSPPSGMLRIAPNPPVLPSALGHGC